MVESTQKQLRGLLLRLKHIGLPRDTLETAARVGWASRGVLYVILGALATLAAVGEGGGLHDGTGVVRWILDLPAGAVMVGIAACGFAGYALYCAALMCFGQENVDGKLAGVVARLKGAVGLLVYGSLTLTSVQLLLGQHAQGDSKRVWITQLLTQPWGHVLFGLFGAGLIAFGLYQCRYAATGKHRDEVNAQAMSSNEQHTFDWIGRIGLSARGVVFIVIGYFSVRAAFQTSSSATTGTASALREIRDVGWVPLAVLALGLAAYGVLQFFYAKYRKVEVA